MNLKVDPVFAKLRSDKRFRTSSQELGSDLKDFLECADLSAALVRCDLSPLLLQIYLVRQRELLPRP